MKDQKHKDNDDVIIDEETTKRDANSDSVSDVDDVSYEEEGETSKDTIKKLREKLATTEREKMEYLESMQRIKADYVNARKRDDEAKIELTRYANLSFAEEILPILDSFEQAMANKETWEKLPSEWRGGMESIYGKLVSVFNKNNIVAYANIGDTFDPSVHHSIQIEKTADKTQDATISKVLQRGYKMGDKLIRPAMVAVYEYQDLTSTV